MAKLKKQQLKTRLNGHKCLPFWSWNDKLCKEELSRQIEWMNDRGVGGFFMHARAGLKTEYLSDEWMDCVKHCCGKAKELGMQAWIYDENGWPSGFVGGKLLEDVKNRENYLEYGIGKYDDAAYSHYSIKGGQLKRIYKDGGQECLNIYLRRSVSTVDVLDGEVTDKFIAHTHERYKQLFGGKIDGNLVGFFTDEPQYNRINIPYPHKLADYYFSEYNSDILDKLGLMFVECDGYREFRYRFWKGCQHLFLQNYAKKVYDWCSKNGVMLTGHYVEERDLFAQMLFNGGIMPFYEYMHIPGIDWLCRRFMSVVPMRQVGSVAAQLGKREVLSEMYAMTGWDVTPKELKIIAEYQYVYGINRMCQHLLPYSEAGERKRDYPAHFSWVNPWVDAAFGRFNCYFDLLGDIMAQSTEYVNVAVFHPIRSAYFVYKHKDESSTKLLDDNLIAVADSLANRHIAFHFIDETIFKRYGGVEGSRLVCGSVSYEYLIFPDAYTMDISTERLLREFVAAGGKVLLTGKKPKYLEGQEYGYDYLISNVSLDEIACAQAYTVVSDCKGVHSVYKKYGDCDLIFLVNISEEKTACGSILIGGQIPQLTEVDLNTGDKKMHSGNGFQLLPYSSKLFLCDGKNSKAGCFDAKITEKNRVVALPENDFEVIFSSDNYLLLDTAAYSFDGKSYFETAPLQGIFSEMLSLRYEGDLYLKFKFNVKTVPKTVCLMIEENGFLEVTVNGKRVDFDKNSKIDKGLLLGDISSCLNCGENTVKVKLHFFEDERVYNALFGNGVTEGLKNCLVYNTTIENLYLCGDFGVYSAGGFKRGKKSGVLIADDFYIDIKKHRIDDLTTDGYPFFAGNIRLKKTVSLPCADVSLKVCGRFHYLKLYVNGSYAGELLFDDQIDISRYAKAGDNQIEIELFTGNRNFLGPHHDNRFEEPFMVTPTAFSLFGTWKDCKSADYRDSYTFVKIGIFGGHF